MSTTIEHKVPLENGVFANTVGPAEVIDAMYPVGSTDPSNVYFGPPKVDRTGVYLVAVNSVLRFTDLEGSRRAILGGTVTGKCPVAPSCGNCALAGSGLSIAEMSDRNCARANTAQAFELANQEPRGRFVLLPTSKDAFVVGEDRLTDEYNGGDLMQRRLQSANSVVFTESWLREQGLEQFTVGMNGADGSMGVATANIDGEKIVIAFCSMRQNMGDREPEDQILRQALNAYFDSKSFDEAKRSEVLGALDVSITLAASASVGYFAHKIKIPRETDDAPAAEKEYAGLLRATYPGLIDLAGGKITSAIVLEEQFRGALRRGHIYPELEAQMVERGADLPTPITPDRCPGDGQTCNVDYRRETEYALVEQLKQMGVSADGIHFDDSNVLDPSNPGNKAASNRAEQNNGVKVANTNRTLNAMLVRI